MRPADDLGGRGRRSVVVIIMIIIIMIITIITIEVEVRLQWESTGFELGTMAGGGGATGGDPGDLLCNNDNI